MKQKREEKDHRELDELCTFPHGMWEFGYLKLAKSLEGDTFK